MNPYMTVLIWSLTEGLQVFDNLNASYSTSDALHYKVAVVLPHLLLQLPATVGLSSPHSSIPWGENPKFVAETAMFSTDCAEDENDSVVREAHKLENALDDL
ncbi:hypothetical protein EDD17DRAFT_1533330 [Pisolithus thermaeus]|nr:hypothetical protein EDD17DRAFT_1533330 [Pisolithus thermaeus]